MRATLPSMMRRSRSRTPTKTVPSNGNLRRESASEHFEEDSSVPLLHSSEVETSPSGSRKPLVKGNSNPKMKFFDNLRGWDRPKVYRYCILLALSLSGDGW